jgi:hypothetical protein
MVSGLFWPSEGEAKADRRLAGLAFLLRSASYGGQAGFSQTVADPGEGGLPASPHGFAVAFGSQFHTLASCRGYDPHNFTPMLGVHQALHATSEPAPDADSSAHEG